MNKLLATVSILFLKESCYFFKTVQTSYFERYLIIARYLDMFARNKFIQGVMKTRYIVRDTLLLQTCQNPWFPKPAILTHTNSQSVESPFSLDGSRSVIAAFDRLYNFIYWLVQSADILCWLSTCLLVQFPFSLRQPHFLGSVLLAKIISNPNNAFFYIFSEFVSSQFSTLNICLLFLQVNLLCLNNNFYSIRNSPFSHKLI